MDWKITKTLSDNKSTQLRNAQNKKIKNRKFWFKEVEPVLKRHNSSINVQSLIRLEGKNFINILINSFKYVL